MAAFARKLAVASSLLLAHSFAHAEELPPEKVRNRVWSLSLTGKRHAWESGKNNELKGNVAQVQIANGYVSRSWYLLGSLDIIMGPYSPTRGREINLDYYGTGLTLWWGFSAQLGDLRSKNDGYGFALGLSYADVIGRSSSSGSKEINNKTENVALYQMRVSSIEVTPAIFFSWLEPGRAKGNKPELLNTRIEGYVLLAGLAIPVHAPYQAKYEYIDATTNTRTPGRETGQFKGYSVLVSLQTLLGI